MLAINRNPLQTVIGQNEPTQDFLGIATAGQAMNRYRGTQAEFQFSIVAPHTAHSKLLISRSAIMC
jgi:hypothetical protein